MKSLEKNRIRHRDKPVVYVPDLLGLISAGALAVSGFNSHSAFWRGFYVLIIIGVIGKLAIDSLTIIKGRIHIFIDRIEIKRFPWKKQVVLKTDIQRIIATKSHVHVFMGDEEIEIQHESLKKQDRDVLIEQLLKWEIPTTCKLWRD